jgi:uracil-DNA glycosylase family 4
VASGNSQSNLSLAARAFLAREIDLGLDAVPRPERTARSDKPPRLSGAAGSVEAAAAEPPKEQAVNSRSGPDVSESTAVAAPSARPPDPPPTMQELDGALVERSVREATSLELLRTALGDCDRCKLCSGRTNIVFGVGNPDADLMFIGEGPGADEDAQGVPFVGKAGRLLTDIITKGIGIPRDEVYIANVVKCRPPNNRDPEPDEILACQPFLHRQVAIIRPRAIVTLGKFATQCLLETRTPISKLRGNWHDYRGVPLMPTFHPAYLLRNAREKRVVWEDIKQVMARIGLPVSASSGS